MRFNQIFNGVLSLLLFPFWLLLLHSSYGPFLMFQYKQAELAGLINARWHSVWPVVRVTFNGPA